MSANRHNLKSKMAYIEVGIIAVVGVIVAIAYAVSQAFPVVD